MEAIAKQLCDVALRELGKSATRALLLDFAHPRTFSVSKTGETPSGALARVAPFRSSSELALVPAPPDSQSKDAMWVVEAIPFESRSSLPTECTWIAITAQESQEEWAPVRSGRKRTEQNLPARQPQGEERRWKGEPPPWRTKRAHPEGVAPTR